MATVADVIDLVRGHLALVSLHSDDQGAGATTLKEALTLEKFAAGLVSSHGVFVVEALESTRPDRKGSNGRRTTRLEVTIASRARGAIGTTQPDAVAAWRLAERAADAIEVVNQVAACTVDRIQYLGAQDGDSAVGHLLYVIAIHEGG